MISQLRLFIALKQKDGSKDLRENLNTWKILHLCHPWLRNGSHVYCSLGICRQLKLEISRKHKHVVISHLWTLWTCITGYILKQFGACPWDYTPFHGDFMGLVTLEYAPLWYIGALVHEQLVMHYTRRIFFGPLKEQEVKASSESSTVNGLTEKRKV
ncbi:hypothetical protein BgiMline_007168 [Biomphalaria glabrata]|nr:transmembrane protein 229B [Biomphalaria glabrata]